MNRLFKIHLEIEFWSKDDRNEKFSQIDQNRIIQNRYPKVSLVPTSHNEIELTVSDNGVGLPKDLEFKKTNSSGLHLVTILVEDQLIHLDRKKGTKFRIKFKQGLS